MLGHRNIFEIIWWCRRRGPTWLLRILFVWFWAVWDWADDIALMLAMPYGCLFYFLISANVRKYSFVGWITCVRIQPWRDPIGCRSRKRRVDYFRRACSWNARHEKRQKRPHPWRQVFKCKTAYHTDHSCLFHVLFFDLVVRKKKEKKVASSILATQQNTKNHLTSC